MPGRLPKFGFAWILVAAILGLASHARPDDPADAERQKRLKALKTKIGEFELSLGDNEEKPLKHTEEPMLRYSNPIRNSLTDGGTFLWLDGERPVAVATISIRAEGKIFREFTSLSGEPLVCRKADRSVWSPKTGGLVAQRLAEAPAPQDTAVKRLTQMRTLARRFSATIYRENDPVELRLMPQPIHRFTHEKAGILDGGLFSFAEATDPEALLLLEAVRDKPDADPVWKFTLARMTSVQLTMRLDDREILKVENFWKNPRTPGDPYVEAFEGTFSASSSP